MYIQDEIAARKSKMLARPVCCNGEKTGTKCKHYYSFAAKTDAQNAEFLNLGEKFRNCTVCPGWLIEFDGWESLPHTCDRYVPDYHGLRWLAWKIGQFFFGTRKLDRSFEDYTPTTTEEVAQLTKEAHDEERERIKKLHDGTHKPENAYDTNLHDVVGSFVGKGVPGQTTMATPEMLKEQVKNIEAVREGKVSIDDVLASMGLSNDSPSQLVKIGSGNKKSTKKKNAKILKIEQSDIEKLSDNGIFGESNE